MLKWMKICGAIMIMDLDDMLYMQMSCHMKCCVEGMHTSVWKVILCTQML